VKSYWGRFCIMASCYVSHADALPRPYTGVLEHSRVFSVALYHAGVAVSVATTLLILTLWHIAIR